MPKGFTSGAAFSAAPIDEASIREKKRREWIIRPYCGPLTRREKYIGGNKIGEKKVENWRKVAALKRVWCNYYEAAILGPGTIGQPRPR